MARLDATAMWFERGENEETLAATEYTETRRRVPTVAWIAGAVTLAIAAFAAVVLCASHASASRREPAAAATTAPPPLTIVAPAPQAAPSGAAVAPPETPAAAAPQEARTTVAPPAPSAKPAATHAPVAPALHARAATEKAHRPSAPVVSPDVIAAEKLLRHGRAGAALARFQVAIAHDGSDERALRGACMSLAQLSRLDDAARVCRRALESNPGDIEARRALAGAYYSGGAYKWSAAEWRRVVAQDPHDVKARRALHAAEARAQKG
jgi:tetratricopeptide (TPR) repeat protein